jgi:hypothetical protein
MLKNDSMKSMIFIISIFAIVFSMTGCSTIPMLNRATETPTAIPFTNTPLPSPTSVPPTATPAPTKTSAPSATALPPLAIVPDGINPWCLSIKNFFAYAEGPNGPASMPEGGQAGTVDKVTGRINFHIPAVSCTLVLAFNQPIPDGMKLQVWDARPQEPFIIYDMKANPSNPKEGYAILNHTYLIDPPAWWMDYTFVAVTADGREVLRSPVRVFKSLPEKCWDGSLPNPISLFCPIQDS